MDLERICPSGNEFKRVARNPLIRFVKEVLFETSLKKDPANVCENLRFLTLKKKNILYCIKKN
jgi:hypothetical protein